MKQSWDTFLTTFKAQYISENLQHSVQLLESELFETLKLSRGQQLDDVYAQLIEKAQFLKKNQIKKF